MGRRPGFTHSPETRAKIGAKKKGVLYSDEARANMSASKKASWANPEYRANALKGLKRLTDAQRVLRDERTRQYMKAYMAKKRAKEKAEREQIERAVQSGLRMVEKAKAMTKQLEYGITRKEMA